VNAAEFVSRLGAKGKPRKTSSGWQCCCPAHEDKNASLSVGEGADGRVLLCCHAGCDPKDICAKLDLTLADLFPPKDTRNGSGKRIVATYDYHDASGKVVFQVVRFDPKDFRQRKPDATATDGWTWNTKGVEKVLFRLPEILRDIQSGKFVFICEGCKDVLAMVQRGFTATCNPGGAGKWQDNYTETLRGVNTVIIPDRDEPGQAHAQLVAGKLHGVVKSVRVIGLPDVQGKLVKDAFDFFAAGGDAGQIFELVDATPEWTPAAPVADSNRAGIAREYLGEESEPKQADLPPIVDAADFIAAPLDMPPELVAGVLHRGSKLALGGSSKAFKTWTLLDLALSIAHGADWLGFPTAQGKVLFVNFEIQPHSWQRRIAAVVRAKGVELKPGAIQLWNLRGHAADFRSLIPRIIQRTRREGFSLVIIDPIYKLYGGTDENAAGDVAALLNSLERLAVETGAAVAYGCHFAKGNAATKEALDRISGSGVFARDPDSLLIFTKHEEADAFTVEPILRNFAPVVPFCVRWQFPLMQPDEELDPAKLKQVAGRKPENSPEDLLKVLPADGLANPDFLTAAKEQGISERSYYRLKRELEKGEKILLSKVTGKWTPILTKTKN
jgi:hypothetical protein